MTLKTVLLLDDLKVSLNLDTAFELREEEADGLMIGGILFFCRHHTNMIAEQNGGKTPILAYHPFPMIDGDRLVEVLKRAREKRDAVEESAEPKVEFNRDAWGDIFGPAKES
jgi:hypothetical protein